jgi:ATP-dependent DNA ligase
MLRKVIADAPRIRYTDHIDEQGVTLFRLANQLQLEGIVGKRADAPYPNGGFRSKDWVKIKTAHGRTSTTSARSGTSAVAFRCSMRL